MEHFEGHGDHFNALGFEDDEILENIPKFFENGILAKNYIYEISVENSRILPYMYPEINDVQICSLIESKNNKNIIESFYPVLEGIKNSIVIGNKYTWENNLEGEIEIIREDNFNLSFFAPFYLNNFSDKKNGSDVEAYLSGLAFFVEEAMMNFEVDKGDMYEIALRNFLNDNPGKTKGDFPSVTLHMDGAIMLFPTHSYSVYEYRGKILDLGYVTFLNKKLAKLKVCIEKTDEKYNLFINLYVELNNVRNCELKIGKEIQCTFWLMGYTK